MLHYLTAAQLGVKLRAREVSSVEITQHLLSRIDALDDELGAYTTVCVERALEDAARADRELARGEARGPFHGVPIALKDLCDTAGIRTAAGTRVMRDRIPIDDAIVTERLARAGAVLLGKLQMTEGACGEHHPDVEPPKNPWSAAHWTGVSSSGSGVATAAGLCFASLGTDTAGSIRFPALCCGVVGLKPTWGRVPLRGIFPLANSLDHAGPMTRCAEDAGNFLRAIAGPDPRDRAAARAPVVEYAAPGNLSRDIRGLRVGYDRRYATEGVQPPLAAAVQGTAEALEKLGAQVRDVTMPALDTVLPAFVPIIHAEIAAAHRDLYPGHESSYASLGGLVERGMRVSGAELALALAERRRYAGELEALFDDVDLVLCPPATGPAFPLAMLGPRPDAATLRARAGFDTTLPFLRFTAPFDLSGSPTITFPRGRTEGGLPLGAQLVARHFAEDLLVAVVHQLERRGDVDRVHPPL